MLLSSAKYREWHENASRQLKGAQKIDSKRLEFHFYFPDNRKCDLTNKAESVADLLVDNGLLEDDNWHVINDLRMFGECVDKENPRVEIIW